MTWTFYDPVFSREDGDMESACIYDALKVEGGFCAGLQVSKIGIEPTAVWFKF